MKLCPKCRAKLVNGNHLGQITPEDNLIACLRRQLHNTKKHFAAIINAQQYDDLEITQLCGKALGYPWFKDDQKNFPGATEKDGVCIGEHVTVTIVMELAAAYKALKQSYEPRTPKHSQAGHCRPQPDSQHGSKRL